jgi:EAL domain-containing protein (putative c-di-GMP-specific phosphodiesterase class I)
MKNPNESKAILTRFAQQGIKISIDDFDSGYSSLAYFTQFPIDTIKIDKFFLIDLLARPQIKHIVNATVTFRKI